MADRKDRIDIIRMRMPGSRRAELSIAWPRAVARAGLVGAATIFVLLIGFIGNGYSELGMRGAIGLAAITGLMLTLFSYYLERFHTARLKPFDSPFRQWMFALLAMGLAFLFRIEIALGIDGSWMLIALPAPLVSILLAVLYDQRFAFDTTLLMYALMAVLSGMDGHLDAELGTTLAALFLGSCVGVLQARQLRSRVKLLKVGLLSGVAMATAVMAFQLLGMDGRDSADRGTFDYLMWIGIALANGVLTGVLATSMIPLLEHGFGLVTEIRLMELEDGNHPLLRQMLERAPGTYMHTQNVARIASAGVEAIGGNALLARVGTLFHDLGKMVRPEYFTENEPNSKLFHDRLSPAMSGMIIISHVKEGLVLARQHKLPRIIEDFITGHHGTSCVKYFYRMAKMQAREGERIDESQFRYPGPKPQTREAAIVAVADLVEAAGRAKLDGQQTPATIQKFVHECVMIKLNDRQFDECDITLKDLRLAEEAMVKTLASMYHHRVKYPDDPDARKKKLAILEKEEYRKKQAKRRESILTQ